MDNVARQQLQTWLMLTPVALVIGVLFIGGLSLALIQSLGYFPPLDEHSFTLRHYTHLFLERELWESLALTIELSLVATVIAAVVGVGFAIANDERSAKNQAQGHCSAAAGSGSGPVCKVVESNCDH